ncbi:MAG: hypothetical protein AAFY28_20395, partial [Actinomycetota bacterium]
MKGLPMKSKMTTALLAATLVGGGIVGAGTLASAQYDGGGSDETVDQPSEQPAPAEQPAEETNEPVDQPATPNPNALQQVPGDDPAPGDGDGRRGGCNDEVASILGLTNTELRAERQEGASLAAIAADQGVEVQALVDAIVEDKAERLAEKVAAGELTQEEADEKLARAEARAEDRVNGTPDGDDGD